MKQVFTLAFVRKDNQVLLARKLKKIGAGYWNGFGGKVETGETVEEAAIRECREEIHIIADAVIHRGALTFSGEAYEKLIEVHVFEISTFSGTPTATNEMGEPTWFEIKDIPYDQMWEDDKYWFPLFLKGSHFRGHFVIDADKGVVEYSLQELESEMVNKGIDKISW